MIKSLLSESEVYVSKGNVVQASEKLYRAAEECVSFSQSTSSSARLLRRG